MFCSVTQGPWNIILNKSGTIKLASGASSWYWWLHPGSSASSHHRRLLSPPALPLSTGSSSLHWLFLSPLALPGSSPADLLSAFTDKMWRPAAAAPAPAVTAVFHVAAADGKRAASSGCAAPQKRHREFTYNVSHRNTQIYIFFNLF